MKEIKDYRIAKTFLKDIKESGIMYQKLKQVLFGKQAIAFISAVRKHGQKAFTDLKKAYRFTYMANVGIRECLKKP